MAYSRSAVANVEVGRQNIPRVFWQRADGELAAGGALLAAFDELDGLVRTYRAQIARAAEQERLRRHGGLQVPGLVWPDGAATGVPGLFHDGAAEPADCGCAVTVARWSGRETLALRQALRLSLRAFAERLGVATATVSKWEDRRRPVPPSLAMQAVLDDALKLADLDAGTRFRMIVASAPADPGRRAPARAPIARDRAMVTPLRADPHSRPRRDPNRKAAAFPGQCGDAQREPESLVLLAIPGGGDRAEHPRLRVCRPTPRAGDSRGGQ
jgi:DNA-binding transcriptional regulator YiaG